MRLIETLQEPGLGVSGVKGLGGVGFASQRCLPVGSIVVPFGDYLIGFYI